MNSLSQVARVTGVTVELKRIMGVETGLELITLPHGGQLRQDLLERWVCMCDDDDIWLCMMML